MRLSTRILTLCIALGMVYSANAGEFSFVHENVLGTSLEIRIEARDLATAQQAETAALSEIDRLAKIFSTYDSQSELSRFIAQPVNQTVPVSSEMAAMMQQSTVWQQRTGSAYHPGAEKLYQLWKSAAVANQLPAAETLLNAVHAIQQPAWELAGDLKTATRMSTDRFGFNAMAEGFILDRVVDRLQREHRPERLLINLGGEVRVTGSAFPVAVRDPQNSAVNQAPLMTISLANRAMSTSGGYRRGFVIQGQEYSHIIDPRTGQPVQQVLSSTVVANTATEADVLATAFSVLPITEALELADAQADVCCLLVDHQGAFWFNRRWQETFGKPVQSGNPAHAQDSDSNQNPSAFAQASGKDAGKVDGKSGSSKASGKEAKQESAAVWNKGMELEVALQIQQPEGGNRYRRPYVAVWVEDKDGFPVKTLALWVQSTGPGPRWIPDLRRWYKSDKLRKLADDTDLVATVSEATHKPGNYKLIWDGKDDQGKLVEAGEYTVYIEAAREHGTYQLIKQAVKLNEDAAKFEPKGNVEIKSATIDYRQQKARKK